jgi:HEAT repeat protein
MHLIRSLSMRIFVGLAIATSLGCANRARQSITLYESGDYAGAARAADQGLARHPDDADLWGMRVRAALALGDADSVAKAYAAYVAQRGDDDQVLLRDLADATLGQAVASPSARLKILAIDAIASQRIEDLADDVIQRLGDEDDRVAATAAIAVLHAHPQAPQIADSMLKSEDPEARRIAVDGIGRKVGKLALADLEKAAADPDARVRATALRWLGTLKDRDAVELCLRHLKDPDEAVRAAAATALARIAIGNLAAAGKQALADRALAVRLAGLELLEAAHAEADLVAASDDANAMVAVYAAIAVKHTHPELVTKAIGRGMNAEDWTTRAGVANVLAQALTKDLAVSYAERLASDKEVAVQLAAARVLAHAGAVAQATPVFAAAISSDHGVQAAADLAELGDARGTDALSTFVRDPQRTPEQRAEAATAHRVAHRITPGLVAALADSNGLVRVEAAAVIRELAK